MWRPSRTDAHPAKLGGKAPQVPPALSRQCGPGPSLSAPRPGAPRGRSAAQWFSPGPPPRSLIGRCRAGLALLTSSQGSGGGPGAGECARELGLRGAGIQAQLAGVGLPGKLQETRARQRAGPDPWELTEAGRAPSPPETHDPGLARAAAGVGVRLCMAPAAAMTSLPLGVKVEDSAFAKPAGGGAGQAPGAAAATATAMGTDEEGAKPKVPASLLPFSVEALMADHRKPGAKESVLVASEGAQAAGGSVQHLGTRPGSLGAPDAPSSPRPLGHFSVGGLLKLPEDALVKAESPEKLDRTPWMQSPRFSPPPASE